MWPAGLASDPRGKADCAGLLCVSRAHSRVSPDSTPQGLATAAGHGRLDQSKATGPGRQRHARGHARSRGAGVTQCRLPWPHSGSAGQRHLPGRTAEPRCSWPRVRRGDLLQDPLPPLPSGAGSGTTGGSAAAAVCHLHSALCRGQKTSRASGFRVPMTDRCSLHSRVKTAHTELSPGTPLGPFLRRGTRPGSPASSGRLTQEGMASSGHEWPCCHNCAHPYGYHRLYSHLLSNFHFNASNQGMKAFSIYSPSFC